MAEEIKQQNNTQPAAAPAPQQGRPFGRRPFGPRPQGQGQQGQGQGGFRPAGRPGFGRAGFGRDVQKDEFESKLLDLARVTRVTGGGKRMKFRAVVVAGNKKGKIGIGIDKGKDVSQAVEKATRRAKKNLILVAITNETIPHEVMAKAGPAVILLKPQMKGRGLVAGGAVRTICDLAGIKNISSKILSGSKNKLNNARATVKALGKLKAKTNAK